ncbi:hypothetical protein U9M48_026077 [Paspalum notatum var. saurae]|uniref:Uncharacterized protein n=1 Tax=Paspalum notatum var. saurae TaxID=547442 RepID=A0AAQ3TRW9_PASNO
MAKRAAGRAGEPLRPGSGGAALRPVAAPHGARSPAPAAAAPFSSSRAEAWPRGANCAAPLCRAVASATWESRPVWAPRPSPAAAAPGLGGDARRGVARWGPWFALERAKREWAAHQWQDGKNADKEIYGSVIVHIFPLLGDYPRKEFFLKKVNATTSGARPQRQTSQKRQSSLQHDSPEASSETPDPVTTSKEQMEMPASGNPTHTLKVVSNPVHQAATASTPQDTPRFDGDRAVPAGKRT